MNLEWRIGLLTAMLVWWIAESCFADEGALTRLAAELGGQGRVIVNGAVVHTWGDQVARVDWMSSAKPVLSTLLFFAVEEGLVKGVDQPIVEFGWDGFSEKDQGITFRHLGSMTSGYARQEGPGAAWAYNDFAIQLYQRTLFDKVYQGVPEEISDAPARLGALGLEDGLDWRETNRRLKASVRDFAKIAQFWLQKGSWNGAQVLPARYFDEYVKPQVASSVVHTAKAETGDYLGIGTYGGGSDHFTKYGPGIYGFNWWFNTTGRDHPDSRTWPDAPEDMFMSIGAGGNCAAMFPSLNAVVVCAKGNWGEIEAGTSESRMNHMLALSVEAIGQARAAK
jgi:CubicO group peptidase (beta-lactamase class C family)